MTNTVSGEIWRHWNGEEAFFLGTADEGGNPGWIAEPGGNVAGRQYPISRAACFLPLYRVRAVFLSAFTRNRADRRAAPRRASPLPASTATLALTVRVRVNQFGRAEGRVGGSRLSNCPKYWNQVPGLVFKRSRYN